MNHSETITEISKAVIEFHSKMVRVTKDAKNPFYHNTYASLGNIIEQTEKALNECGLAVIQFPKGKCELETILIHSSGEWLSEIYEMTPVKNDPQGIGSTITYQRRYAYGAILSLNIDEDDDGNAGSKPEGKKDPVYAKDNPGPAPERKDGKTAISSKRFQEMLDAFKRTPGSVKTIVASARALYTFTDEQELIVNDWESTI